MRSVIKNYIGMISIAVVIVMIFGAIAMQIEDSEDVQAPGGIEATPAITGNAPRGLVDVRWLQQYQAQVDFIFDLSDLAQYEAGHIPGAIHLWWQDGIAINSENYAEPTQLRHSVDAANPYEPFNLQVPQNARIVLYDSNNSERASWFLWVMTINGYTDAHVLDGGLPAWIGAGEELSTETTDPRQKTMVGTPTWDEQSLIRREALRNNLDNDNLRIVDTRSSVEQLDTVNGTIRQGRIPGSINIQTTEVMREDGTFKSREELQEILASYGLTPDTDVVVYSLFSSQSGNLWLALQIAGYNNVVIYMEGFVGWARDEEMPVDTEPYYAEELVATPLAATPLAATPVGSPAATPEPDATPKPERTATPASTPEEDGPTDLTET